MGNILVREVSMPVALLSKITNDSLTSFAYLQAPLIDKPSIPRLFIEPRSPDIGLIVPSILLESKLVHSNVESQSTETTAFLLNAFCDISDVMNRITVYNLRREWELGSSVDLKNRRSFLTELLACHRRLPDQAQTEMNFTPATWCVRQVSNVRLRDPSN
jgi:hypothetical protein